VQGGLRHPEYKYTRLPRPSWLCSIQLKEIDISWIWNFVAR